MVTRQSALGSHDARCNTHRHELLEQQLAGIGDLNLRDLSLVLAATALKAGGLQVRDGNQSTQVADVDAVSI